MKKHVERESFRIDKQLLDEVRSLADLEERTYTNQVERLLREGLNARKRRGAK